jgi:hypothetical protein
VKHHYSVDYTGFKVLMDSGNRLAVSLKLPHPERGAMLYLLMTGRFHRGPFPVKKADVLSCAKEPQG